MTKIYVLFLFSVLCLAGTFVHAKGLSYIISVNFLENPSWLGTYKIGSEEATCSFIFCKCCPKEGSILRIDKNTATRKDNSFIMRGESSGVFCGENLIYPFELPEAGAKKAVVTIFEKRYELSLVGKKINFTCLDSPKCSFVAEREISDYAQYDAVINIDSILALGTTGWEVTFRDREDFNRKSKKDTIVIGVAGMYNKGKTWFVNKVANKNFSAGFHIHTAGLSMKYAEFENKAASYLDTAGFETPITFFSEKDELLGSNMTTEELTSLHQIKIKDRHLTEHFLQNFIFEKADIIVIVVGHLSFSDQKLINRILTQRGNKNKEIFILHNYFEIQEIKHVNELIDRDIHGSFDVKTAPLEISKELSQTGYYHQEIYLNKQFPNVRHLVTASEGTPAGNYFNPPVFDFFRALVQSKSPNENFDILGVLQNYTINNFEKYLDSDGKEYKIRLEQGGEANPRFRCILNGVLKLKPISFDVNGALIKTSDVNYHADYDFILTSKNMLHFIIDLPNIKKDAQGKRIVSYKWEKVDKNCLIFDAELEDIKAPEQKDIVIVQNRRRGKIQITPPCLDNYYEVFDKHEKVAYENGTLTMVFKVQRKKDSKIDVEL